MFDDVGAVQPAGTWTVTEEPDSNAPLVLLVNVKGSVLLEPATTVVGDTMVPLPLAAAVVKLVGVPK